MTQAAGSVCVFGESWLGGGGATSAGGLGMGLSFLELPLGPEENLQDQWSSNKSKHESFEKVNSLGTPKDKMELLY